MKARGWGGGEMEKGGLTSLSLDLSFSPPFSQGEPDIQATKSCKVSLNYLSLRELMSTKHYRIHGVGIKVTAKLSNTCRQF